MRIQRIVTLLLVGVCAAMVESGCLSNRQTKAREEALARWEGVRAGMALQLAEQQFDNGQLDRARQTLLAAVETQSNDARLYLLLARVMFELQDLPAAEASLKQAGRLAPEMAEVDYLQGVLAQSASQWPQAHQAYLAAYQRNPSSQSYLCALAEAKLALGQYQAAAELLSSRFEDFPSSAHLHIAAANSFLVMEDFDRAEQLYQQGIDIDPSNAEAQEGLANTFYLAGKYSQASRLLARLIKKSPSEYPALQHMLGDCYLAAGQYSQAIRTYLACLAENPEEPGVRLRLAQAWLLDGKAEKAREELQTLLDQQGGNPKAWELLGHSYLQDRKFGLAAQAYRWAMNGGGDPTQLQFLLDLCKGQEQTYAPSKARPAAVSSADPQITNLARE